MCSGDGTRLFFLLAQWNLFWVLDLVFPSQRYLISILERNFFTFSFVHWCLDWSWLTVFVHQEITECLSQSNPFKFISINFSKILPISMRCFSLNDSVLKVNDLLETMMMITSVASLSLFLCSEKRSIDLSLSSNLLSDWWCEQVLLVIKKFIDWTFTCC